jgi:N-acetyl-anhydromuramyl-L-alanine amidase AmpD
MTYRPWVDRTARHIADPLWRLRYLQAVAPAPAPVPRPRWKPALVSIACVLLAGAASPVRRNPAPPPPSLIRFPPAPPAAAVWSVESTAAYETFSNGLRIENRFAIGNRARSYVAFSRQPAGREESRTQPVGIVYHTTESLQAPFEASQNTTLKRVTESLAEYVQRRRAYNFLIDRFGRVYRIVREGDAANHAGHSVWADDAWIYVNLNDSFLGVSFEAETAIADRINPAQVRSAAMLTEMLRACYGIAAANCVTHAQVSVNPSNYRIGYHTDWASSFPFERLGLPDNYRLPLPSIALFGFQYDATFVSRAGQRLSEAASQTVVAFDKRSSRARFLKMSATHNSMEGF